MWQQWSLKACWQVREHDVLHLTNLGTDQSRWIRKRDDGWRREKRDERLTVRWWGCTVSISLWQCQSWKCSDCLVWSWMNKSSVNSWGWFPRLYWQNPANCFSVSARAFHQRHCKGNWDCCWGKNKLTFTAVTPALCAWNWVRNREQSSQWERYPTHLHSRVTTKILNNWMKRIRKPCLIVLALWLVAQQA